MLSPRVGEHIEAEFEQEDMVKQRTGLSQKVQELLAAKIGIFKIMKKKSAITIYLQTPFRFW